MGLTRSRRKYWTKVLYFGGKYILCDFDDYWRIAEFDTRADAMAYAKSRGWKVE